MTSFKNLVFIAHPSGRGIMSKYRFDNGKVLSIVAGPGFYSTPGGIDSEEEIMNESEVSSFEVMFDEEVIGWQTREDINKIFKSNQ